MSRLILIVLFAVSMTLNIFLGGKLLVAQKQSASKSDQSQNLPYLSKRIFVEKQNDIIINFIPLRQALKEYVERSENKVGVYFEYLPSGTSIGVNDREEVKLVSLSKVPLAMSIYKKIEQGQMLLTDSLVIKKEQLDQNFGDLWKRGEGAKLSVENLLKLALAESDNTAYNVLFDTLTYQEIGEVYEGLDISLNQEEKGGEIYPLVSPKNYSSIFRSLYLSSFLSEENSNQILDILTKTPFSDKIDAGLPDNIQVAHKIGVFETSDISQDLFTDCGIVYVPKRPYILCIFVKDTNELAQKHMLNISKMVYGYIVAVRERK